MATPMQVRIEVYGDDITARELVATGNRAVAMEPLWREIITRMEEIERQQFDSEGARGGSRWPELSMETMWRKFREGKSLAILRATDAMHDSLVGDTASSVRFMTPDSLEFGSTTEQFGIQQDHSPASPFPERLPINFTEADRLTFGRMMLEYITGGVDSLGRPFRRDPSSGRFLPL